MGTGAGGQGFVEDQHGPDASNPSTNRSWPRVNWSGYNNSGNAEVHPATGDLDGDGGLEVVIGSAYGNVYAINGDGNEEWSFDTGDWVGSSPAIADIDGDGELEVIVGSTNNNVYALDK